MATRMPHIIGIAGGSCAGKTWLARRLESRLGEKAARISLDDFYHDRSHLPPGRRMMVNFDHPRAVDWKRLEEVLGALGRGESVSVPRYNFKTHGRQSGEPLIQPGKVVIVEGLWLFRRPSLRKLFDLKIYVRGSRQWCEARRLERDVAERGRKPEDVAAQLTRFTFPMFERFVAPQEKWADVVLQAPVTENRIEQLAEEIESREWSVSGI